MRLRLSGTVDTSEQSSFNDLRFFWPSSSFDFAGSSLVLSSPSSLSLSLGESQSFVLSSSSPASPVFAFDFVLQLDAADSSLISLVDTSICQDCLTNDTVETESPSFLVSAGNVFLPSDSDNSCNQFVFLRRAYDAAGCQAK